MLMYKMVGVYVCAAVAGLWIFEHGGLANMNPAASRTDAQPVALVQPAEQKPALQKPAEHYSEKRRLGSASAKRDRAGHYSFKAYLNGRSSRVLVDTGATSVAINLSTARRIGLNIGPSDFKYTARTANGDVDMAQATIRSVEIDGVHVRDVKAAVLPDNALSDILLGMSFLNKLDRFEFRDGELVLHQ